MPKALKGVAVFSFKRLCAEARGAPDYLAIARRYHTVILVGIPVLGPHNNNEAARFKVLIDALYDGKSEQFIETQVKFEDGRKGAVSATLQIIDAKTHPARAVA